MFRDTVLRAPATAAQLSLSTLSTLPPNEHVGLRMGGGPKSWGEVSSSKLNLEGMGGGFGRLAIWGELPPIPKGGGGEFSTPLFPPGPGGTRDPYRTHR